MRSWLKEMRLQKGLTQYEVAKKAKIERSYYTMIELGNRTPSVYVAKKIGKAIGFNWTIFFDHDCNETKHFELKSKSKEVS
jgi:putative transcriptional regulator